LNPDGGQTDSIARRARARRQRDILRRRRLAVGLAAVVLALIAFVLGARSGAGDEERSPSVGAEAPGAELPGGGFEILPASRVVAYYGAPQDQELGILGIGPPDRAADRLLHQAELYDREGRPVLPALELISTVATADPGNDGSYSDRQTGNVIERYLTAARRVDALLILDIQPGRADFMDEVEHLTEYLEEPDVGLALDPEWHLGPGEIPGDVIGSVSAQAVNDVSAYLAQIVEQHDLPQKLLIVHQFTADMISNREQLVPQPGVASVLNSDGFGDQPNKIAKYKQLRPGAGLDAFYPGFKLFYGEDIELMSPEQVLELNPAPDVVIYE
jgi:hypothetical protein